MEFDGNEGIAAAFIAAIFNHTKITRAKMLT
jgi:hypothetical protein